MKKISLTKPHKLPMPEDTKVVKYKKIMVHFLDHNNNPMNRKRECTYPIDNFGFNGHQIFIDSLKGIYKTVNILDKENKIEQVSVVLEEGQDLNDSFDLRGLSSDNKRTYNHK